jgi:iron(III) transport system permease protein
LEVRRKFVQIEHKKWVLASLFVGFLLLLPMFFLFTKLFQVPSFDFFYLWDTLLLDYSFNTFYLILITSVFAIIFGVMPAWFVSNYDFKLRNFFDLVLYLPLAIPTYIMSFTYSDLLSYTGPLQFFLRKNIPDVAPYFNNDYLQIEVLGVLLGLALYPYVYTALRVSFSLIGSSYIDVAKNLGLSDVKMFFKVVLPLSKPALFSGLFLVVMEVLNEYGAVKYFGVNTYTAGIFRAWFSMGSENTAIQLACLLILLVGFILILERMTQKQSKFYYQTNTKQKPLTMPKLSTRVAIYMSCSVPFILGFLIPLIYILNNSIQQFMVVDFSRLFALSFNSIKVSFIASVFIILIALFFLYVEKISKLKLNTIITNITSLGYVIPGAVIGLAVILLFTQFPLFNNHLLVGSFFVLIYAYVFRFLAVGKSPIKSSLDKQPKAFEDTSKVLGVSSFKALRTIHLPLNKMALVIAFIVTFIDLLKELPITLILRPFNFDTLATQTYEFAVEEMLKASSIYSLMIIVIGSVLLILLKYITNKQIHAFRSF